MSLTLLFWFGLFGALAIGALFRPVFGVGLYLLTFFALPPLWWWGKSIPTLSWGLLAGFILLGSVLFHFRSIAAQEPRWVKWANGASLGMIANFIFVHVVMAPLWDFSFPVCVLQLKLMLLYHLMRLALHNRADFMAFLLAITLGGAFIGFEVTIEKVGKIKASRLEGIGLPGASNSNSLAALMVTILPVMGGLIFAGRRIPKWIAFVGCPLALNVLLLCNSRGAFLGALAGAIFLLIVARGAARRRAVFGLALGAIAVLILAADPKIVDRFLTTFRSQEELDRSATSRIDYWKAGLKCIAMHPLGVGGDGYKRIYGPRILARDLDIVYNARSVHNGHINEGADWGVQGFLLRWGFIGFAMAAAFSSMRYQLTLANNNDAFLGACLIAALGALMIHAMFGTFLDAEWGIWLAAACVSYARLYGPLANPTAPNHGPMMRASIAT